MCQEQVPLGQVVESFGSDLPPTMIELSMVPTPRLWFISASNDEIVQIQRDRFLCNWRKTSSEHAYPRYEAVSTSFFERLESFRGFLREQMAAELTFTQFEITYINHVAGGSAEQAFADIGNFLPDLCWRSEKRFLPAPSGVDAKYSFDLPDGRTRLHSKVNTGRRKDNGNPVLILDMTARGVGPDLAVWFATAHEWIVRGFTDLTSHTAHQQWGRES